MLAPLASDDRKPLEPLTSHVRNAVRRCAGWGDAVITRFQGLGSLRQLLWVAIAVLALAIWLWVLWTEPAHRK